MNSMAGLWLPMNIMGRAFMVIIFSAGFSSIGRTCRGIAHVFMKSSMEWITGI